MGVGHKSKNSLAPGIAFFEFTYHYFYIMRCSLYIFLMIFSVFSEYVLLLDCL